MMEKLKITYGFLRNGEIGWERKNQFKILFIFQNNINKGNNLRIREP